MAANLGRVLDCADPERLAEFWSAAIGYTTLGGAGNDVLLIQGRRVDFIDALRAADHAARPLSQPVQLVVICASSS